MWELIKSIFDPNFIPIYVVIIGGLITLYQVRGNTISNARIAWIENFRNIVSEYCVYSEKAILQISNMIYKKEKNNIKFYPEFMEDYQIYFSYHTESTKYSNKVKLYLKLKHNNFDKLNELMLKVDNAIATSFNKYDEVYIVDVRNNIKEIINVANYIIFEEWEKSKSYFYKVKKKFNEFKEEYNSLNK